MVTFGILSSKTIPIFVQGTCTLLVHASAGRTASLALEVGHANTGSLESTSRNDPNMPVEKILETVAGRWAIEEFFHDTKEVWGDGKKQVRNVWSNIDCWNINAWLYGLFELECWDAV